MKTMVKVTIYLTILMGVSLILTDFSVASLAASLRNVSFGLITQSVKC